MRHSDKKHSIRLLTALLSALPLTVGAAGLGKLTVQSAIGQPLRAEVELSASPEELASMSAKLASAASFKQAGVEFASSLAGVRISVDKRRGRPVLVVTSDRAVSEPYLDMLIELNWSSGRLVREYTFLLDPADMPRPAPVEPVAVPGGDSSRPAATRTAPAPAAREAAPAGGSTREVLRGETLRRIATETAPSGVSLDQMLVALVRANPEAFDGGNMNRLRAGRILTIPDQATAESVSPQEARQIVSAQTADFAAYRSRLAGSVASQPVAAESTGRSSGGKIAARVEDKAPAAAPAADQVRVSKSAAADGGKINALEEEVVAKDRALKDANSRLAELERNVRDLQKLVELKNTPMADAQKAAAPAPAPAAAPQPAAKPAPAPAPKAEDKPVPDLIAAAEKPVEKAADKAADKPADKPVPDLIALADEKKPAETPAAEAPKPAPVEPPKPAPAPAPDVEPEAAVEEPGMLSDPATLGGLGAVLALLLGYFGWRRRKASEPVADLAPPSTTAGMEPVAASTSVIGATGGGQSVDTSASSIQTDFSQSSLSSIDADEGVDPVAEADVYMAYGRDAQAEEILLEALKSEPSRHAIHLKLLEIYAQRKSVKQFETLATELYAQTGGKGADWEKAAQLGRSVDPGNPLYGGGAPEPEPEPDVQAAMAATVVVSGADKLRDTWTLPGDIGQLVSGDVADDNQSTVTLDPHQVPQLEEEAPAPSADIGLDFDLDVPPADDVPVAPVVGVATTLTKPGEESEGESSLDFDLGLDFTKPEEPADVSTLVLERNVADAAEALSQEGAPAFDLDLSLPAEGEAVDPAAVVDLERTDIGNLIDFNFDASDAPAAPVAQAEPVIDLSDINLDLGSDPSTLETDVVGDVAKALEEALPAAEEDMPPSAVSTVINPEDMLGGEEPPQSAAEEAETKLELARAYEEMGDKEGARELLQEVVREGTPEQQSQATDMLSRLG